MDGGDGDDLLAAFGNAFLFGGNGNDTLELASTQPIEATGGSGADTFQIQYSGSANNYSVTDFNPEEGDQIVVTSSVGDELTKDHIGVLTGDDGSNTYNIIYISTEAGQEIYTVIGTVVGESLTFSSIYAAISVA